jgi:hypothetical protein
LETVRKRISMKRIILVVAAMAITAGFALVSEYGFERCEAGID